MTFCVSRSLARLPPPAPTCACAPEGFGSPCLRPRVNVKICSVFFLPGQWPLVAQVIEVKFEKLDLEPDTYCRYDYVALFNGGESDNSRRIGKFCGDRAPG